MSVTEEQRVALWQWLEEHMGKERAGTMMSLLPPSGWGDLATKQDLARLEERHETRFRGIDRRYADVDRRLDQVDRRLEQIDVRIDGVQQAIVSSSQRYVAWLLASHAALLTAAAAFGALG